MENQGIDWTGVDEKMARQIYEQGHAFLAAQLQAALAGDARATAMAGLYTTLALATLAGGFAYWDKTDGLSPLLAGLVAGAFLIAAAIVSAWAARPTDFYFPGNQPKHWFEGRTSDLTEMLGGEAENYDDRIQSNDALLSQNQHAIRAAFALAIIAPLAGALAWLIPLIFPSSPG